MKKFVEKNNYKLQINFTDEF